MKKLQNRKTGEIGNLVLNINPNRESYCVLSTENGDTICGNLVIADYDTLDELNAEWKDYEKPKKHYSIKEFGRVYGLFDTEISCDSTLSDYREIGNYFETEEEAVKAVEKLKAWKRLKDNGFEFTGWKRNAPHYGDFTISAEDQTSCDDMDLDLLFGGEE